MTVELWLPHWGRLRIGCLKLRGHTEFQAATPRDTRWITYGSSITQCRDVAGPTDTWSARVARALDWDLQCLGFDGEAHLDITAARTIAAAGADIVSLCLGVNVHSQGSYNRRTLPAQIAAFLGIVRDGHPDVPIVVITPLWSQTRDQHANTAGMTLADVRGVVAATVSQLANLGDKDLHLVSGPDVLGPADADLLSDGLHPNRRGYAILAERLTPLLSACADQ